MSAWFIQIAVQQDYLLFLASLAWMGAAVVWWRFARLAPDWRWLPWSAGGGALAAWLEIVYFTKPVPVLLGVPPYLATDRIHGLITAVVVAGWLHADGREGRVRRGLCRTAMAAVVGVALSRWLDPAPALGELWLVLTATACWAASPSLARSASVVALWAASNGPLAEAVSQSKLWTNISTWGLLWSSAQLAAALLALAGLARDRRLSVADAEERKAWFPLLAGCGVWVAVGLALAAWMGRLARENFEAAALSRVKTAAALMDRSAAAAVLTSDFRLREIFEFRPPSGRIILNGKVALLNTPAGAALRAELKRVEEANTDVFEVHATTLRSGWIIDVASGRHRLASQEVVSLTNRVTDEHRRAWEEKAARYLPPFYTNGSLATAVQAPLVDYGGRMLGWLTFRFHTAHWLASQAQARSLVFVVVALGVGLVVLIGLQRRRVREREAARAAAEAAAAADKLKTAFLAKVSHELRTPIQSILGYGELLRAAISDPTGRARLAALRQHGELMLRLVNDLLDLSAMQAGAFRLHPKPTALPELVRLTTESLQSRALEKGLSLGCRIDPAVPQWVRIDGERIRQVVLNLVGNAIKFTDQGFVEANLAPGAAANEWKFVVTDSGPGIAPADRARLFQPFSRLHATAAKEGTGLGLSLAAALCRSMQGGICVENAAGGGACFSATFQAPPCAPELVREAVPSGLLVGLKLLVVEDNTLVRELFAAFLAEQGAHPVACGDGESALAAAANTRFDAVVLDLGLPGMDGHEIARRLRVQGGHALRIIGVSAHAAEAERDRALASGMNAFLTKPVELSRLAAALAPAEFDAAPVVREELMARLTACFRAEAATQRSALAAAIDERDMRAIRCAAHYLKNSAAVVRDDNLYTACCAVESAAGVADLVGVQRHWSECQRALDPWTEPDFHADASSSVTPTSRKERIHHAS